MDDIITMNGMSFKYNENEDAYGRVLDLDGNKVLVKIYDTDNIKNNIKTACEVIEKLDIEFLKEFISKEYFDKGQVEVKITRDEFKEAIDLDLIVVDNKYVEYWFDDGDIYGGHNIVVSNSIKDNKLSVDLEG